MAVIEIAEERVIAAPAARVYRSIADYDEHQRFLPPAFSDFRIEEGGVGAGTVMRFNVRAGGMTRAAHHRVSEPEPGRVLTESEIGADMATTFTVTPEGDMSRVRIVTRWTAGGVRGFVERLLAPRMLRALYRDELARMERYVVENPEGAPRAAQLVASGH